MKEALKMQMPSPFDQAVWCEINFNEPHTEQLRVCYIVLLPP